MHGSYDYPRINILRWRATRFLISRIILLPMRITSVSIFSLVIVAGLIGDQNSTNNLAPTMTWVIWWVGFAYFSALIGNIWGLLNPLKITFEWAESLYRRLEREGTLSFNLPYPNKLGVWPGTVLFLCFAWAEIVYTEAGLPFRIAQMAIIYSLVTWAGMLVFGKERWIQSGDAFSLAFGFLSKFAPIEVRVLDPQVCGNCSVACLDEEGKCIDCHNCFGKAPPAMRELNLRPFAVGLLRHESISPSMMIFVILILATVTFDGFSATKMWSDMEVSISDHISNPTIIDSLGLIILPIVFIGTYLLFSLFMAITSGRQVPTVKLARAFVYSLIPIALAYHLAHFLSFLLIQGQLIIPLASDPFGFGWNLLGTADHGINIAIINARFAWFAAVTAIVTGHITAVYLAHVIALRTLKDIEPALRSQYPMLVLMVGYTIISLWILAQPAFY
jgi:hypothetical protein